MFTGLVEAKGRIISQRRSSSGSRIDIETGLEGLKIGESIAVNGVCQTVVSTDRGRFSCDILPETLRVTNLGSLKAGCSVNIERAMLPDSRIGGHIVNGHVDGTGTVKKVTRSPLSIEISVGRDISRYLVAKGSVAVDGVSLTIGPDPGMSAFRVFVIPHTWENTTLGEVTPGRKVNIEIDILAKYIDKFTRK